MIHVLQARIDDIFDVISNQRSELCIDAEFHTDQNVRRKITEVMEVRPSRGIFIDESTRPFWARVKTQLS